MNKNIVYTSNKGILEIIEPFEFKRGTVNEYMGQAKDKQGNTYNIYVHGCDLPTCACSARAEIINNMKLISEELIRFVKEKEYTVKAFGLEIRFIKSISEDSIAGHDYDLSYIGEEQEKLTDDQMEELEEFINTLN